GWLREPDERRAAQVGAGLYDALARIGCTLQLPGTALLDDLAVRRIGGLGCLHRLARVGRGLRKRRIGPVGATVGGPEAGGAAVDEAGVGVVQCRLAVLVGQEHVAARVEGELVLLDVAGPARTRLAIRPEHADE